MVKYIPTRGDVVWLDFDPQKGREIQKTRPALVISSQKYNRKTGLALFMPITSHIKGYPFEVAIETSEVVGAVLCDQIRSLDWNARNARFVARISPTIVADIIARFKVLLDE